MVLAGCLVDEEIEEEFKKLGIKDSKQISPKKRQELARIIKEKALAFEITLTFPNEITEKNKNGVNLNTIEAQKAAEIINKVNKAQGKILVYIDTPSPNLKAWQNVLEGYIENKDNLEIHCEHKADQNHVSCSAASILAKTTRDAEVEKIKKLVGVDFGSGYPSDPLTCKFLKEYAEKHKHDGIFRETWSTWKQVCAKKEQKTLDF
ncbi:MAG: ribonuclease HII [Nanoarchaeota archaeon]|nr:ribonuclease HII [Nanoarchaeota archaeon]